MKINVFSFKFLMLFECDIIKNYNKIKRDM